MKCGDTAKDGTAQHKVSSNVRTATVAVHNNAQSARAGARTHTHTHFAQVREGKQRLRFCRCNRAMHIEGGEDRSKVKVQPFVLLEHHQASRRHMGRQQGR